MARRQRSDTAERSPSARRYSQRERLSEPDMDDVFAENGIAEDDIMERTGALDDEFDDDIAAMYVDEDLDEASLEELQEIADELEIDEYEEMDRSELAREIRARI